jgi:hypothetical protein
VLTVLTHSLATLSHWPAAICIEVRAFPNCSFDFWNQPEEGRRHADDFFSRSFRGYLEHVIGFGPEFGELWARTLGETSAFVDRCALGGTAPHHYATFICHKG